MATIIQKPDTLSLSRNLKELIISTSSEISLQLLKGDSLLLEETYLPDVNNRVHVNLADIVTSTLSLTIPSGDAVSTSQSSVYSDFTVKVDGTSVAEFTAVRSGVERFSDTAANFLTANWLTWQPQVKEVLHDQPEWLTYYPASGSCACYARFYYTDGTSGEKKVCDVSQCVSINTRFSKLWALDESGKERYGVIDVYIKDAQGLRLTYVQRYVLCSQGALDEVYLCENSLGGLDTFRFYGDRKLVPEIGYTSLLLDNSYTAADPDLSRKWSQNTGMLTGRECEWCWELFRSSAAYHLYRGTILPIVLDASSVEKSAMSVLAAYSFDYRYASDLGLLNVVRSENLPEVVELSGPDAEVFFLTPRLNEFPSAVLSDDLIIPVQSPYEESWYTLSVGGLKSALLSSVETIYGPMWHEHDNLQVLNGLSVDSSGNLLYNGVQVGSGIVGAHDHHGETIRPEKIIVGDVEITCVDGRLHISKGLVSDGDLAAFGAEEDEEGGSGGLDIARLWEELAAEDTSKVIDVSHIPGSVVLQGELVEILDDYPLTTEMNEALAGKAGKDWVEEELAKYLLLTGGKISGDLEVTGTLKIGEAVLSYQDGRLRISKGVVSDGDLAAFGAEEDEEGGSGGLDIARLWEELAAEDTSKVIDVSHIPGSVVLQDELIEVLDDYPLTTEMNVALAGKAALQHTHAISEVTGLQSALNSKWEWNASQVAGVKVSSAVAADRLATARRINGTSFDGTSDIVTARWGATRTITVWDFYNVNKQAAQGIDGSSDFALKLPQSIKVKTLNIDGVTLSVVGGRLHVDSTMTADGDLVAYGDGEGSSGGGLDEEAMWAALGGSMSSKVISPSHLPSLSSLSGNLDSSRITGLDSALASYATQSWVTSQNYATQEWTAGQYVKKSGDTMSGNLIVSGASFYKKMNNDTSNATSAIGWKKAADDTTLATIGYYNVRKAIYINSHIYETADLWQDAAGKYTLYIGINDLTYNTYPILRSDNIGSYALTPSNYTSTLDSRYVKKAGDTMTGVLQFPDNVAATGQPTIKFGTLGQIGCDKGFGSWLQYNNNYIHVTDAGPRYNNTYTIWHSGNDGSGSGLDADTVDGTHSYNLFITNAGGLSSSQLDTFVNRQSGTYNVSYSGESRTLTVFRGIGSSSAIELLSRYTGQLWCRWTIDSNRYNEAGFREFAFTDSNVASATKLATARSLWGNSFDGGQNLTGRIWAYNGINIGSLDDYGWYNSSNRISCGLNVARGCNVGSLLVSNAWADSTKVPSYGIYSKGAVVIDGTLTAGGNVIAYSSSSRLVKDILPAVSYSRRLKSLGRVVEYKYNALLERDRLVHTGLIYENVRDVMPSMCFMHDGYGALNYLDKDYICTIAGAVQENIDDIAYLKNRVASLEAEVERLRRGLAA